MSSNAQASWVDANSSSTQFDHYFKFYSELSNGTPFISFPLQTCLLFNCPKLPSGSRSSHEIITIGDSPIAKNPPPHSLYWFNRFTVICSHPQPKATSTGSIHVPAISSTSRALSLMSENDECYWEITCMSNGYSMAV